MEEKLITTMQVLETADPADVNIVRNGLRIYNEQFASSDIDSLYVMLRDEGGTLVGGLLGSIYWGWLEVHILWIDERYRGQGHGERMMAAAEAEARRRGCSHVQLDTLSFQARPFYEKIGYRVYGELADCPAGSGHTRYYMTKSL